MAIKFLNTVAVDTNVLYVNAATNKVGIGTAAPGSELHVNGNVLLSNNKELRWLNSTGAQESILELNGSDLLSLTGPGRIRIVPDGNAAIDLFSGHNTKYTMSSVHSWEDNNSNVALRITAGGNVGITDASPNRQLTLGGAAPILSLHSTSTTGESSIYFGDPDDDNAGRIVYSNSQNAMQIFTAAGERIRIKNNGDTGIGTTTPEARLHVVSANPVTGATGNGTLVVEDDVATIQILSSSTRTGFINFGDVQSGSSGSISYIHLVDEMRFSVNNNAGGMAIDGAANVRIGGTSANAKLDVDGGVKIANDTDAAVADKAGTLRYRYLPDTPKSQSKVDMCMQTGLNSYAWVNIVTNTWNN